jgi:uncharacterized RDD family membrane protein YckC
VRGRLNAIVLDLLLLGVATRLLQGALGDSARSTDALLLFAGLQFAYFFACEASNGQTIGKRVFHVRVATLTGTPLTARQAAIRNVLRFADALPIFYASGLLSIMRTGRARRQRIGDVVAGTTVVLDAHGKPLATPRWLLPVATILATATSFAVILPLVNSHGVATRKARVNDSAAKTQARALEIAAETVAVPNGEYAEVQLARLEALEPTLRDHSVAIPSVLVGGKAGEYEVASESKVTGHVFRLKRNAAGEVSRTCTTAGSGGCPASGT